MAPKVKTVYVSHGLFNTIDQKKIEKQIGKYYKDGFELATRMEVKGGCGRPNQTQLTFVKKDA